MAATISQILNHAWPNRGGWTVQGDAITPGDGGAVPSLQEIEDQRAAVEAAIAAAESVSTQSAAIEATYQETLEAGLQINGKNYLLGLTEVDQANWVKLQAALKLGEDVGQLTPQSTVKFRDRSGAWQTSTLAEFRVMMWQVSAALMAADETRANALAALQNP
jgi:hypothetical protein